MKEADYSLVIDQFNVRAPKPSDIPFILDSSIRCLQKYKRTMWFGWRDYDIREYLHNTLLRALTSGYFTMLIACKRDDEDAIAAYIVANPAKNQILLQYTKFIYRNYQIQKKMLLPFMVDTNKIIYMQYSTHFSADKAKKGKVYVRDFLSEYAWACHDDYLNLVAEKDAA